MFHYQLMKQSSSVKWGILFSLNQASLTSEIPYIKSTHNCYFCHLLFELDCRRVTILLPTLVNFWVIKRGLQRNHYLSHHWMRKPGSQRGLFLRSTMEVTADEWRSVLRLENIVFAKPASEGFRITPSCLPACLSAHVHLSIRICHSCPFPLSLSNSLYCAFYELYLCFPLSFTSVCLTLFFCLPSLLLPSLHSPTSKHVSPPQ